MPKILLIHLNNLMVSHPLQMLICQGDIKYTDLNGDGVVNENDMTAMGSPQVPEIIYGFGISAGYRDFDLSVFMQGAAKVSFFINPNDIFHL